MRAGLSNSSAQARPQVPGSTAFSHTKVRSKKSFSNLNKTFG